MNRKGSGRRKKRQGRYPYLWAVVYGLLLAGYTVFTLADAFLIPHDVVGVETPQKKTGTSRENGNTDAVVTDRSYKSAAISISIAEERKFDTDLYIADVTLTDPSLLQSGLAGGVFGRNVKETTSKMAEDNDAVFAVNGDYYGFRDSGYVLRNGYLYRSRGRDSEDDECLVLNRDGGMEIVRESAKSAEELEKDALQIYSFGPGLLRDGRVTVDTYTEVEKAMLSNPRTAIGMVEPLHYLFVVSDGRTEESRGLSLYELAQVMKEKGCSLAYNMDGGGSATMWFMGAVINHPTDGWHERERGLSDIVYIREEP